MPTLQIIEGLQSPKRRSMPCGSKPFVAQEQCFAYSEESGTCQKSSRESPREGVREIQLPKGDAVDYRIGQATVNCSHQVAKPWQPDRDALLCTKVARNPQEDQITTAEHHSAFFVFSARVEFLHDYDDVCLRGPMWPFRALIVLTRISVLYHSDSR
jgi:hypothetical protein